MTMSDLSEIIADLDKTVAVMKPLAERGVIAARKDMQGMKKLIDSGNLSDLESDLLTQRVNEIENDLAKWDRLCG
jgi:hypothetical protein